MRKYLIGITNNKHRLGNEGTLIINYKSNNKIKELGYKFSKRHNHKEVYILYSYPQYVCELDNNSFIQYVKTNGKKLI